MTQSKLLQFHIIGYLIQLPILIALDQHVACTSRNGIAHRLAVRRKEILEEKEEEEKSQYEAITRCEHKYRNPK
jgi:hypothetical protein